MAAQEHRSRLPRLASSPDRDLPRLPTTSLKRKASDEIAGPSKAPATTSVLTGRPVRPLSQNKTTAAASTISLGRPGQSLTVPSIRRPLGNSNVQPKARATRAVSAPIKTRPVTGIVNGRRTTPEPGSGRIATRGARPGTVPAIHEEQWDRVQEQFDTMSSMMDADRAKVANLETFRTNLVNELSNTRTQELETRRGLIAAADELEHLKKKHARDMHDMELDLNRKENELMEAKEDLSAAKDDLVREKATVSTLKSVLSQRDNEQLILKEQLRAFESRFSGLQAESEGLVGMKSRLLYELETSESRVKELEAELIEAETLRRKLHNQVQELKGNIRVFCRVRPALGDENDGADGLASYSFPDRRECKEIVVSSTSESATGASRDIVTPFTFDRVFEPHCSQSEVFEEISHLTQSCIDGYNVCIFAYGQTGSGKSFTMEGGNTEATRGMIPRAVQKVFQVSEELRKKGWEYKMEGQFLEIYNETIVDLLGKGNELKHEIKHDKSGRTTVTDVIVYPLTSPKHVERLLELAQSRRTVHATLMNERSSRSHSVFTLRISGNNATTGERSEGSLNLVDLAGSERLNSSGAANHKDRLKETQAINKSLSALGDVIAALGEKAGTDKGHIPYRNSKLTYLLQNSLSGNSKTLMFLNLSPLAAHLGESLCSLRFATKVNNTSIGTAKKAASSFVLTVFSNIFI